MAGFVYIWRDKKKKRYYVGSHWGAEDDGYVCSSTWMLRAYKKRPEDFKRKVICKVTTNRSDLLNKEQKYLSCIKEHEIKRKYYNLNRVCSMNQWFMCDDKRLTVGQKISKALKGRKNPPLPSTILKRSISNTGLKRSEESKAKMSAAAKNRVGMHHSEETKRKMSISRKRYWEELNVSQH
jgi:hypothetical protein